jgi:hypothetical protein
MKKLGAIAIILVATALPSLAQTTVGELLAAGGQQITKIRFEEGVKKHDGIDVTLDLKSMVASLKFKADGDISGNAQSQRGSSGVFGTWKTEGDGAICWKLRVTANGANYDGCFYAFSHNGKMRMSASGNNAEAALVNGEISLPL